ncbi:uncharacterized protein [Physcomitrium patens]|uniref:Uncharacterized protein n=1 Tax=Physcomitrium patens TaxID=3218 RepID=A0A7I4BN68_PHYPA|nr:uncharacterized protein LOC112285697 [Physcomitrium patens]|eukprot:XP_024382484.1 uncharacterized protein LOC112285697 [Physcomitrella patens]
MERAQELEKLKSTMEEKSTVVGDRGPRPHRCNDRLEDFVQALFEGDPRKNLPGPAILFWRCYKSKPGEEPTEPFFFLEEDKNGKLVPKGRR